MAHLIKPNGVATDFQPKNGTTFTLEELQAAVEGYIEPVHTSVESYLVNEDGMRLYQDVNVVASLRAGFRLWGPVIAMTHDEYHATMETNDGD